MAEHNSSRARRPHLALYGNAKIVRVYCAQCDGFALVIGGKKACCGAPPEEDQPESAHRMSEPEDQRRRPPLADQRQILEDQEGRCFYCEREPGSWIWFRGKMRRVQTHWDHLMPYSFAQNNATQNFVAACAWCNLWKHSHVFQTVEEAQVAMRAIWDEKLAADSSQGR